jgi:hypothetical protein
MPKLDTTSLAIAVVWYLVGIACSYRYWRRVIGPSMVKPLMPADVVLVSMTLVMAACGATLGPLVLVVIVLVEDAVNSHTP